MKKPLLFAALLCGFTFAATAFAASEHQPGFKFNGGKFSVDPTVNVGLSWESNMNNSATHEDSGFIWRIQPALALSYSAKKTTIGSNMFYSLERAFDGDKGGDRDSYGINFSLLQKMNERTRLTLTGAYVRTEDDQFYWTNDPNSPGMINEDASENYNFNAALGYTAKKWHSSLGAGWRRTKQLDGFKQVSDAFNFSGMWGKAMGEHTYWDVSLGATIDRPNDGDDSISYTLMTGVSGELSARTAYSAMLGVTMYDYSGYVDETAYGPAYNISGSYRLTRKITLSLAASSRYESEYAGGGAAEHYYVFNHSITAAANFQWTDLLSSRLDLRYSLEQHEDAGGGYGNRDRTYYQLAASTYYKFNQFATLFGQLSYSNDETDGGSDKDNVRCEMGLSFRF
jgi:hypothetical protein